MKKIELDQVIEVLNNCMENAHITCEMLDDNLPDIGMDSITFVQIIVSLEERFECEIPDEKLLISQMDTVHKIVDVLQSI